MKQELLIGITESGVMHTDADPPIPLDTKFQMVKESGVYDYFDKTPPLDLDTTIDGAAKNTNYRFSQEAGFTFLVGMKIYSWKTFVSGHVLAVWSTTPKSSWTIKMVLW